jgi:putative endonuclease
MNPFAWIYIISNANNTTLYIGATTDLKTRLWEHRTKQNPDCFTAKYNVCKLVYYEEFDSFEDALKRERYLKGKTRKWKEDIIKTMNSEWNDLTETVSQ